MYNFPNTFYNIKTIFNEFPSIFIFVSDLLHIVSFNCSMDK